jgi:ribulose-phosphate 3-epimerase
MAIICPTITANEPHEYRVQMERIAHFAERVHIDLADGVFTPNKLIDLKHVWWPAGLMADIHLMYQAPKPFLQQLIKLEPHMVIVQAEAVGNFYDISRPLKEAGIKVGIALLAETPVSKIADALGDIDHVLIFSGNLGYQGGSHADTSLLSKVHELTKLHKHLEIGWDGGVNEQNVARLAKGGIDVINVGGGIHHTENPAQAFRTLQARTSEASS